MQATTVITLVQAAAGLVAVFAGFFALENWLTKGEAQSEADEMQHSSDAM